LDTWNGTELRWDQTTRKGVNLVLQLNFSNQHDDMFRRYMKPDRFYHAFRSEGHPVMQPNTRAVFRETLAWARIDLDFDTNEALVEEIQNDWLRRVRRWLVFLQRRERCGCKVTRSAYGTHATPLQMKAYFQQTLDRYEDIWAEAMLSATIWFIRHELGIKRIYYHSYESGARLKNISYARPPRSLYSQLPRRFCFQPTGETPEFLQSDSDFSRRVRRKKLTDLRWQYLDLGVCHA